MKPLEKRKYLLTSAELHKFTVRVSGVQRGVKMISDPVGVASSPL
jgi:hypothetical protein